MTTNKVVSVQHSMETLAVGSETLVPITDLEGRTVYIEKHLLVKGHTLKQFTRDHGYSHLHADLLVQKIVEGYTVTKACAELQIDYSIYNKWRADNIDFRKRIETALRDRAEYQHDKVLEIAEESREPKTRIEALKWSASVHNQEKFGTKTTLKGDANAPLTFVIQTGVPEQEVIDVTPTETAPEGLLHASPEDGEAAAINYSTEAT